MAVRLNDVEAFAAAQLSHPNIVQIHDIGEVDTTRFFSMEFVPGRSLADVLAERGKLFHYYLWDVDRAYRRGVDGLDFGPGERQLPRPDGVLDHAVGLAALDRVAYTGAASLKCHGTAGWPVEKVTRELRRADTHLRTCFARAGIAPPRRT